MFNDKSIQDDEPRMIINHNKVMYILFNDRENGHPVRTSHFAHGRRLGPHTNRVST